MTKNTMFLSALMGLMLMLSACFPAQTGQPDCDSETQSCAFDFEPLDIEDVDVAPTIKELGGDDVEAGLVIVNETDLIRLVLEAVDPDGDELMFTYGAPLDEDGEWQTQNGDAGEYDVVITVSDGEFEVEKIVKIIVDPVNFAPVFEAYKPSDETAGSLLVSIAELDSVKFSVKADDPDGDLVSYQWLLDGNEVESIEAYELITGYEDAGEHTLDVIISDGELDSRMTWFITVAETNRAPIIEDMDSLIVKETELAELDVVAHDPDGDAVTLSFGAPFDENGIWQTTFDDSGAYTVEIIASDSKDETVYLATVLVENVNREPILSGVEDIAVNENEEVILTVSAYDADGDTVVLAIGDPVGDDMVWQTGYEDAGEYVIAIAAGDGEAIVETSLTLTVLNVNRAPLLDELNDLIVKENETVVISPVAFDPDGDQITYSITEPFTDFTWTPDFESAGTYDVTVSVTDGDLDTSRTFVLTVQDVNRPPTNFTFKVY